MPIGGTYLYAWKPVQNAFNSGWSDVLTPSDNHVLVPITVSTAYVQDYENDVYSGSQSSID
jgi:hypothetical protein